MGESIQRNNFGFMESLGGSGGASESFETISVSGQPNIVAGLNDTLTIKAGSNITLATNPDTKELTINSTASSTLSLPIEDGQSFLKNKDDATKLAQFSLASIATGTERTYTLPNANGTLALTSNIPTIPDPPDLTPYLTKTQFTDTNLNGFLKSIATDTTISFDGVNTFTLTDVGAGWGYYKSGIKYTFTGNRTVTLSGSPVAAGTYFIFFDNTTGVLNYGTSFTFGVDILVATIHFNNSLTPTYLLSDERHKIIMDSDSAYFIHNILGSRLLTVPTLTGYTLNTATDAANTFSISESAAIDQDIKHTLTQLDDTNGVSNTYTVMYRTTSSTWAWKKSPLPFVYNVGNTNAIIQYDNAGTMTNATKTSARYVCSYLIATNAKDDGRYIFVMGRTQHTTVNAAVSENPTTFDWTGFSISEAVIVYKFIWATANANSNIGACTLNSVTLINQGVGSVQVASTDHNTLNNIQGGTTNEYYHITSAQATVLANTSGTNTGDQNIFSTVAVSGQSNVVADTTSDTLTLAAGTGIAITTDATTDTITVSSTVTGENNVFSVLQSSHGFSVGDVIRLNTSGVYVKSQADSAVNSEVIGIVSTVTDVNNFKVTTSGIINSLTGLTVGETYFLSPTTAGAITTTAPSTAGQIKKPILQALSSTMGVVQNLIGVIISSNVADTVLRQANVQNSVVVTGGNLELSGDTSAPGNSKVYGTSASGVKGWRDFPSQGGVLRVLSTTKSDTFTGSSATWADITGLSVSITPTSITSKILVMVTVVACGGGGSYDIHCRLMRDSTPIGIGDAAGSRERSTFSPIDRNLSANETTSRGHTYLDSPSTVSSITYKLQYRSASSSTLYVNRTQADADFAYDDRSISTITVMEIAG